MNSHNRNTETHTENQRNTDPDRQTDRQTDRNTHIHIHIHTHTHIGTHTHTHTHTSGVQHIGHIFEVPIMREAQLLHTHRCPHGVNKCDCMLAHH